ncbi:MAG: serine/threonine protein kinase [Synechococcus sp.]
MTESSPVAVDSVLAGRYRLVRVLLSGDPSQGTLWLARDQGDGDRSVVLHQFEQQEARQRLQRLWPLLRAMRHPQIPRCGEQVTGLDALWLVREWQEGFSYQQRLDQLPPDQRRLPIEEVCQLLRQLLPVLSFVHGRGLVLGALATQTVIRRQVDGLPVPVDLGAVRFRGEAAEPWMDLHGLGTFASLLLGTPSADAQPPGDGVRSVLARLVSDDPQQRFQSADEALLALDAIDTAPTPPAASPSSQLPAVGRRQSRAELRAQGAEGKVWPVLLVLAVSAVVGLGLGWALLSRGGGNGSESSIGNEAIAPTPQTTVSSSDTDQRQQLMRRLRALQIDRSWFLSLVDRSVQLRASETLAGASPDAAWVALAEEWVARLEQLPPDLRRRLGGLRDADWQQQQQALVAQGLSPRVVEQLISAAARDLLPGDGEGQPPREPYRQLWIATAIDRLQDVSVDQVKAVSTAPTNHSARVMAGGARLITLTVPANHRLVLGINGTPLMAMTVLSADGEILHERGPLRVLTLPASVGSPVQVLVTNAGMSSALLTLACRADRLETPQQPQLDRLPDEDPDPIPDSATGAT